MKALSYSLFFIFLICTSCKHHQVTTETVVEEPPPPKPGAAPNDMQVIIGEELLNKSLKALGPISGKEPYDIIFVKDTFTWTLLNPALRLHKGKADFATNVKVVAGKISYTTSCLGDVDIWYDRKLNLINVKIKKCVVEIYTKIFGVKQHITDYDLSKQFTTPFTFEGPTATSSEMEMEMPDGSKRVLYMTTTDCDLSVEERQIVVPCEVAFSLTPPVAIPKK